MQRRPVARLLDCCVRMSKMLSLISKPRDFYLSAASSQLERFSRLPGWPCRPRSALLDTSHHSQIILRVSHRYYLPPSAHLHFSPSRCPGTGASGTARTKSSLRGLKGKMLKTKTLRTVITNKFSRGPGITRSCSPPALAPDLPLLPLILDFSPVKKISGRRLRVLMRRS